MREAAMQLRRKLVSLDGRKGEAKTERGLEGRKEKKGKRGEEEWSMERGKKAGRKRKQRFKI